jgi:hypothetical protein
MTRLTHFALNEALLFVFAGGEEEYASSLTVVATHITVLHRVPNRKGENDFREMSTTDTDSVDEYHPWTLYDENNNILWNHCAYKTYGKNNPTRFTFRGRGSVVVVWYAWPHRIPSIIYQIQTRGSVRGYKILLSLARAIVTEPGESIQIPDNVHILDVSRYLDTTDLPLVHSAVNTPNFSDIAPIDLPSLSSSMGISSHSSSFLSQWPIVSEGNAFFLLYQKPNNTYRIVRRIQSTLIYAQHFVHLHTHAIRFAFGTSLFELLLTPGVPMEASLLNSLSETHAVLSANLLRGYNTFLFPFGHWVPSITELQLFVAAQCQDPEAPRPMVTFPVRGMNSSVGRLNRKHLSFSDKDIKLFG